MIVKVLKPFEIEVVLSIDDDDNVTSESELCREDEIISIDIINQYEHSMYVQFDNGNTCTDFPTLDSGYIEKITEN